jgi:rod shape-determining protein MreD
MSLVNVPPFGVLNFLLVIVLGLLLTAVQAAAFTWTGGIGPEAAVILVIYAAWRAEKWVAVLAAFILGLFRDAADGGLLGIYQTTLILTAWVLNPWRRRLRLEAPLPLMLCVFCLALGGDLLVLTPLTALLAWPSPGFNPVPAFLVSALASALAAPPLFWLLQRLTGAGTADERHG